MIQKQSTIHIAAAVIADVSGRLLVVWKRGTSAFMQPGGKIEPGERAEAALIRELHEELGLSLKPTALRYIDTYTAKAANEPGAIVMAELFEVSIAGTPSPAAEIEEIIWVDPDACDGVALASYDIDASSRGFR